MTLADKITNLRKKMGWSQEQLAERLDISRQSVSKWESGASVPELDKIIKMSDLFAVTTDYLLKEEMNEKSGESTYEEAAGTPSTESLNGIPKKQQDTGRSVSWEEAAAIINLSKEVSPKIALGVTLCILSPIVLLLLGAIADCSSLLSENMAGGIGVVILLIFVAAGAAHLIFYGMKLDKYEYLETKNIYVLPQVQKLVSEKKEEFAPVYQKKIVIGVLLCLCSVIPILVAAAFDSTDFVYVFCVCILLGIISIGVNCFVKYGIIQGSFDKLLEEGDYTRDKKAISKNMNTVAGIYWCFIVAAYLVASFITNQWGITWIIFAVAGILFAAGQGIILLIIHSRN